MEKNKIDFSETDKLSDDEFAPENIKVRITTYIDKDILDKLREEAAESGKKYQSLLNEKLRETVFEEKSIKASIKDLKTRLEIVESKIEAS